MTRRPAALAADERGLTLVLSVLVLVVLALTVTAIISFSTSNLGHSSRTSASEAALYGAEGGFADALARLNSAADPRIGTILPSTTITVGQATVTYAGTYDSPTRRWTITSSATQSSDVGGAAPVERTIVQQAVVSPDLTTVAENPAWNYIYAERPDGCTSFNSSVEIKQPLYINNSLCVNSSIKVFSAAGTMQVGGAAGITMNSSAVIGVAADGSTIQPLPTLKVASLGCRYNTGAYSWPCSGASPPSGQRVNATTQVNTLDAIGKPAIFLSERYDDARPGPKTFCGAGSFGLAATFFDTNTTLDKSAGNRDIMPGSSYDCITPPLAPGLPSGRLKWQTGNPGTLTISGTVFIDGNIVMNDSDKAVVSGKGTIYASGQVLLDSSVQICGKWKASTSTCDWSGWDPNTNLLFLVGGSHGGLPANSIDLNSSVRFQGGLYGVKKIEGDSSVIVQGPQVGYEITYNSSIGSLMIPFANLPPGAPAAPKWQVTPVSGTWREA